MSHSEPVVSSRQHGAAPSSTTGESVRHAVESVIRITFDPTSRAARKAQRRYEQETAKEAAQQTCRAAKVAAATCTDPTVIAQAQSAYDALLAERQRRAQLKRELTIVRQRYIDSKTDCRRAKRASLDADARAGIVTLDGYGQRKPRMRGWLHAMMTPLALAASIVLICLAPAGMMKAACAVYGLSAVLLFGNSALLHLKSWSPRITQLLCGIDFSNIFLIIAGTNTPIVCALPPSVRWPYLAFIWSAALIGTVLHLLWIRMPDWINSVIYVTIGLAPLAIMPILWASPTVGPAATVLIAVGGACYIAGAVCFAIRKPNPILGWFEFHEVFHLGTVAGYVCHVVAVYLVVCGMR